MERDLCYVLVLLRPRKLRVPDATLDSPGCAPCVDYCSIVVRHPATAQYFPIIKGIFLYTISLFSAIYVPTRALAKSAYRGQSFLVHGAIVSTIVSKAGVLQKYGCRPFVALNKISFKKGPPTLF